MANTNENYTQISRHSDDMDYLHVEMENYHWSLEEKTSVKQDISAKCVKIFR